MKPLNRQSEVVFWKLTDGLARVGNCRKIDDSIIVEFVDQTKLGPLVSIAHFDEHPSGDFVRDADMAFLISSIKAITGDLVHDADERIYPVSYRRNGLKEESLVIDNGRWNVRLELQTEICRFADQWMLDISERQSL
jgi:hypothetical protein